MGTLVVKRLIYPNEMKWEANGTQRVNKNFRSKKFNSGNKKTPSLLSIVSNRFRCFVSDRLTVKIAGYQKHMSYSSLQISLLLLVLSPYIQLAFTTIKLLLMMKQYLTLSWRRSLSYRNQSIHLLCKSMNWFLYDRGLHHERVKVFLESFLPENKYKAICSHRTNLNLS